jgi:biopolymer transport protein ExbD
MAKIKKGQKPNTSIPNASLSDIAFLLLIFFMVSTVFVTERGLKVVLPKAENRSKVPKRNVAHIYVEQYSNGEPHVNIDDVNYPIEKVSAIIGRKVMQNNKLLISFKTAAKTSYGIMIDVMEKCKQANALNVIFAADSEN